MRKVYLLCESFCDDYEPYDKVLFAYQFEVDAIMECNRLTVEDTDKRLVYWVLSKELK